LRHQRRVSLKTDRTTAQQTAQLEGDDNVHARLLDCIDDRTNDRTATLQKSFRIWKRCREHAVTDTNGASVPSAYI